DNDFLWVESHGGDVTSYTLYFSLHFEDGGIVRLGVREDFGFADGGTELPRASTAYVLPPLPASSTWVRVAVTTDFTTISLSYDGVQVLGAKEIGGFTPAKVSANLGLSSPGGCSSCTTYQLPSVSGRFDN